MSTDQHKNLSRDPERTREAILDAAEKLFAYKGYEETSLQEIGQEAGVSRGTPGYFFGSKEHLYGAVLERALTAEFASVAEVLTPNPEEMTPDTVIAAAISSFMDFLLARPTFILLLEREALSNARFLQGRSSYLKLFGESLELIKGALASGSYRPVDPLQLLLSITALCWFPLAHTSTFLQPMGIDSKDAEFWKTRKEHIIQLVLNGILL